MFWLINQYALMLINQSEGSLKQFHDHLYKLDKKSSQKFKFDPDSNFLQVSQSFIISVTIKLLEIFVNLECVRYLAHFVT